MQALISVLGRARRELGCRVLKDLAEEGIGSPFRYGIQTSAYDITARGAHRRRERGEVREVRSPLLQDLQVVARPLARLLGARRVVPVRRDLRSRGLSVYLLPTTTLPTSYYLLPATYYYYLNN